MSAVEVTGTPSDRARRGAAVVTIVALAGFVLPESRRRARARGNGTYGRDPLDPDR